MIDKKQDICYIIFSVLKCIHTLRQQPGNILETYYRKIQSAINTSEKLHAAVLLHGGITDADNAYVVDSAKLETYSQG